MIDSSYLLFMHSSKVPHACVLGGLKNVEDVLELNDGISRKISFPDDAEFQMDPEFPNDTVLTDNAINTDQLIVGSAKLQKFLAVRNIDHLEYLPVRIRNHKGKIASADYFVVNPVDPIDCLNLEESGAQRARVSPDKIRRLRRIVLHPERLDPERQIFRLKSFSDVTLVRRELANEIDQAGFKGIRWLELSDYPEL